MRLAIAFVIQLVCINVNASENKTRPTTELLKNHLFKHYDNEIIPDNAAVEVEVMVVCGYYENSPQGALSLNVWEKFIWNDPRLTWDPAKYNGIDIINIHHWNVWKPDILLYNSVIVSPEEYRFGDNNVIISKNGNVMWVPNAKYKTFCTSTGQCKLRIGSWTYSGQKLNITLAEPSAVSLVNYDPNCPVKISNLKTSVESILYPCCPNDPYPEVNISFNVASK